MRLFIVTFVFCLFSCTTKQYTPQDMAQEACECLKLSNTPEFLVCDSVIQESLKAYESDFKWMGEFRDELLRNLKDCTDGAGNLNL